MGAFAAVMTGQGVGAISTIEVFGEKAKDLIQEIFKPAGPKTPKFKPGEILLGSITDGTETIDQVTIGCESPQSFAIHCHGNPLIVADIMKLLGRHDAALLTAEQLLIKVLSEQKDLNTIALEAKLAAPKAKTLEGTKIIANQIDAGLSKTISEWLTNINLLSLNQIKKDASEILKASQAARLIIYGCKAVLAGPPNTGKSTLLNYLAGKQKAIVTDIKGTTRDWVTASCRADSLSLELIDTAGLDEALTAGAENEVEKAAQQKAVKILQQADLVLLVLDNSRPAGQSSPALVEKVADKKVLTVLNKSDLPEKFHAAKLPATLADTVKISAKFGTGIENLLNKIRQICAVTNFNLTAAVCITTRQQNLLKQLTSVKSKDKALSIITELLTAQINCHCEERSDEAISSIKV